MDPFGGYRALPWSERAWGDALFLAALGLTGLLERLQIRLRSTERSVWWASNGRDLINLSALGLMALGLAGAGFSGPLALAIAATLLLWVTAVQVALGERRGAGPLALLAAWALGAPVLGAPEAIHAAYRGALQWLFG
jgi:hypothetical protein